MAFPQTLAAAPLADAAAGTAKVVDYPAHDAGDRLLLVMGWDGNPSVTSIDAVGGDAWVQRVDLVTHLTDGRLYVYEIVARSTGAVAGSVTVTLAASELGGAVIHKITGAHATSVLEATTTIPGSNSNTPDPPVLSPSWGTEDTLYVAVCGWNGNQTVSVFPDGYVGGVIARPTTTTGAEAGCAAAFRESSAGSEDPPIFTATANVAHVAATLAIRPADSGTAPPAPSTSVTAVAGELDVTATGVYAPTLTRSPSAPGILTLLAFQSPAAPGGGNGSPTDPIREWRFEEGAGSTVADESEAGDDLTIAGTGGQWVARADPGLGATAYRFSAAGDGRAQTLITGGDLFAGVEYTIVVYATLPPTLPDGVLAIASAGVTTAQGPFDAEVFDDAVFHTATASGESGAYHATSADGLLRSGHSNSGLTDGEIAAEPAHTTGALHWWTVRCTDLGGGQVQVRQYRDATLLASGDRPALAATIDRVAVANLYDGGRGLTCDVAYAGVWPRPLTDAEIAVLGVGVTGQAVTAAVETGTAQPLGVVAPGAVTVGTFPGGRTLDILVELLLGGVWTDISEWVDADEGVTITRGRGDWSSQVDPAECHLTLLNTDGRFSPRNPFSPYFGQLGRNTQLRLSVTRANSYYRFWGEVASWPQRWDATGTDVRAPITAAGLLRRISKSVPAVQSVLRREIPQTLPGLIAYWPLEDRSGTGRLASALPDVEPMRRHSDAEPDLASYDGFDASAPLLTLNDADFRGNIPWYPVTSGESVIQWGFALHVDSAGSTSGQTIIHLETTGIAQQWEIRYEGAEAGGRIQLRVKDRNGVEIYNSGDLQRNLNGDDCWITVRLVRDEPNQRIRWTVHKLQPGQTEGTDFTGSVTGNVGLGRAQKVVVNYTGGHESVVVGHVVVQSQASGFLRMTGPLAAYEGERAGRRIERLCDEHNLPFASLGNLDDTEPMGPQRVGSLLELLTDAAATDGGMLYEARTMFALGYRTRSSFYNQGAEVAFDYEGEQLSAPLEPVDDDQDTRNDVTATGPRGSARAVLRNGPLSTRNPPSGVGVYEDAIDVNCAAGRFEDHAYWRVRLGTVDEARYPTVAVELGANMQLAADAALTHAILSLNIGDRITVGNLPAWLPPGPISQLIQGWTETLGPFTHDIEWHCAPESPWRVGVWDTSRYDTAGSELAVAAASAASSLQVATTLGPLWTTDVADVPFDIAVAGIQITVVGVLGSTSPQTFAVESATVTKALPAGSAVALTDAEAADRAL